jgi:2-(S-pantetheinyl)-carbapenam-3-carboxylate methyltransferase
LTAAHGARRLGRVTTVGLVQINMGLTWSAPRAGRDDEELSFGLLPYSVGLLQAYAERHAADPGSLEFLPPLYKRLPVDDAAAALAGADVVGLSTYVWNIRLSLAIARALKEARPETLVVLGGPQVPDHAEELLRAHPYVDLACHGEGEATFTRILDRVAERRFDDVPGISYLEPGGAFVARPPAPRITDMAEIPSPYLGATFQPLIDLHPEERWVVIWETNRGCPFSCTFCDWGSATASKVYRFELDRINEEIAWFGERRIGFVFCCDANFGMLPRDVEIAEAVVAEKRRSGYPFSLSVQNTKNATERAYKVQTLLARELNTLGVTISLQSTSPTTLEAIKRQNISSESFEELQRRFARDGVYTYTDLIVGLPGESYDEFARGVAKVVENGQHNHIQFHDCSVLPNAEMGDPEYQRRYGMKFVPQMIRNVHDLAENVDEVPEYLDVVVSTDAMPREDWVRAKTFAWAADLLYFDRLLQVPFALLGDAHGLRVDELIETVLAGQSPTLAWIRKTLEAKAREIQAGGSSYFADPDAGNLLWPADQHLLIRLVLDERLADFYREAEAALRELLAQRGVADFDELLADACELNRALLRLPGQTRDAWLAVSANLWEHYASVLAGEPVPLERGLRFYRVDRTTRAFPTVDDWCEHLVWCHGKDKRGYLYELGSARRVAAAA